MTNERRTIKRLEKEIINLKAESEKQLFDAFKFYDRYKSLPFCLNCNKLLHQEKGKVRKFCDKKCQYQHYKKQGVFKKGMKKYLKKPKNKRKNRENASKYAEIKRKSKPPKYCERCEKELIGNQSKWCKECGKIRQKELMSEWFAIPENRAKVNKMNRIRYRNKKLIIQDKKEVR